MQALAAAALLCWAGALGPAAAQTTNSGGAPQPVHPCVAKPDDQAKGTDSNGTAENRPQASLDECNGVLAPPKTGDQEMRMEPPDKGTTPVIPPGSLPPQQPK